MGKCSYGPLLKLCIKSCDTKLVKYDLTLAKCELLMCRVGLKYTDDLGLN